MAVNSSHKQLSLEKYQLPTLCNVDIFETLFVIYTNENFSNQILLFNQVFSIWFMLHFVIFDMLFFMIPQNTLEYCQHKLEDLV